MAQIPPNPSPLSLRPDLELGRASLVPSPWPLPSSSPSPSHPILSNKLLHTARRPLPALSQGEPSPFPSFPIPPTSSLSHLLPHAINPHLVTFSSNPVPRAERPPARCLHVPCSVLAELKARSLFACQPARSTTDNTIIHRRQRHYQTNRRTNPPWISIDQVIPTSPHFFTVFSSSRTPLQELVSSLRQVEH